MPVILVLALHHLQACHCSSNLSNNGPSLLNLLFNCLPHSTQASVHVWKARNEMETYLEAEHPKAVALQILLGHVLFICTLPGLFGCVI
jgi:uncharacterized membrane protein YgaE (UPF0421/DUF939 family)